MPCMQHGVIEREMPLLLGLVEAACLLVDMLPAAQAYSVEGHVVNVKGV